jgi:hypothetical protein
MDSHPHLTTSALIRHLLARAPDLTNLELDVVEKLQKIEFLLVEYQQFMDKQPSPEDGKEATDGFIEELTVLFGG